MASKKRRQSSARAHFLVHYLARSCRNAAERRDYLVRLDMNDLRRIQAHLGLPRDNNRKSATTTIIRKVK